MKDLVHDLPFPVDFQQREKIGEPMTGPVVELKPHGGDLAATTNVTAMPPLIDWSCVSSATEYLRSSSTNWNALADVTRRSGNNGIGRTEEWNRFSLRC